MCTALSWGKPLIFDEELSEVGKNCRQEVSAHFSCPTRAGN